MRGLVVVLVAGVFAVPVCWYVAGVCLAFQQQVPAVPVRRGGDRSFVSEGAGVPVGSGVLPPLVQPSRGGLVSAVDAYPEVDPESWPAAVELPPEFTGLNRRLASWPAGEVPLVDGGVDPSWPAPQVAPVVSGHGAVDPSWPAPQVVEDLEVEVLAPVAGRWVVFESNVAGGGRLLEVHLSEHGCAVITMNESRDVIYGPTDLDHACVMFGMLQDEARLRSHLQRAVTA